MKRKKNRKNRIRCGKSERFLKIVAVTVSLLFAALMLYPLIFAVSSAMKDNSQIYKVPPKLLPGKANSVSFVLDYTGQEFQNAEEMKDQMLKDNVLVMFGTNFKFADQSIMEIHVYGTREGKTLFHSRAHQMKLQMECDYGIYKRTAIKKEILLHDDRYVRACESIGYEFDEKGIDKVPEEGLADDFQDQIAPVIQEKYTTAGTLVSIGNRTKNLLSLESFKYYLDMPAYIYPQSERVVKYGFLTFVMNSVIVIGFAMIAQVILCSVCAFVISRQLSQRAGKFVLMFFLGGMMIPFASIMLPQLIMYREMGAYNNYAALLLRHFYIPMDFMYICTRDFLIRFPASYFEAAALDGAGSWYLYSSKICMPLSKPIISLIALQTFIGNWNDFFWAWLVTEDQNLWTLNVALYNISNNAGN